MPEEYRLWKEKVDELERKKRLGSSSSAPASALSAGSKVSEIADPASKSVSAATESSLSFATQEEAVEAFKAMLQAKNISVAAKIKEVQDICQKDPRWEALRTQGEKRQALAEYQTKKLKMEREQQKSKARRQRDAFLLMLAENTAIDARTDWNTAASVLKDDQRFRNIEDVREREELFKDFVAELQKKEKEDLTRDRNASLSSLDAVLSKMKSEGVFNRKSIWADYKDELVALLDRSDLRSLHEADVRRSFQKIIEVLNEEHRAAEKARRDQFCETSRILLQEVRKVFEELVEENVLGPLSRLKDAAIQEALAKSASFASLEALFNDFYGEGNQSLETELRNLFERVVEGVRDVYHGDKRAVKHLLSDHNMRIGRESRYEDFVKWLGKMAAQAPAKRPSKEEGEEEDLEPATGKRGRDKLDGARDSAEAIVTSMLQSRQHFAAQIFSELQRQAEIEYEEDMRRQRKAEERFTELLQQYIFRSDHLSTTWEAIKPKLQRRSAYEDLTREDRRRLFQEYMDNLSEKMKSKEESLKALMDSNQSARADRAASTSPPRKRSREDADMEEVDGHSS